MTIKYYIISKRNIVIIVGIWGRTAACFNGFRVTFSPQDWFAFIGNVSDFNFTLVGEAFFPNVGTPTALDNYGFCQVSVSDM